MKTVQIIAATLIGCGLAALTHADPPEGRGWKKHHHKKHYEAREEYWDGNCRVERKWKHNGDYVEERHCQAPRQQVRVVVLPPWFDQRQPEPVYQPEWRPAPQPTTATRCSSDKVGSVLGGLIGGVLGHQIGGGRGKTAATIGGAIAGVLIGGEIGRKMDARNQACVAQALEFAPEGQRITWQNDQGNAQYAVTPGPVEMRGDRYCRSFTAEVQAGQNPQTTQGAACRQSDGTWVRL
ncbi:RT0821/Lpp0805 family surface protein [Microbulbifer hainanensis]|uniref:RT0821/Lpp0805 family surface protein n=1 Tax=Microbulbifer hainanensis TaxID=2735675 RepID=UPI0018674712|nr:RT0821/Lpp0805 family surface protein [Microbulbifer hainanensis]